MLRRVAARMEHSETSTGFRQWEAAWRGRLERDALRGQFAKQWRNRDVLSAFRSWRERSDEIAASKSVMERAVRRIANRSAHAALQTWRSAAASRILASAGKKFSEFQ